MTDRAQIAAGTYVAAAGRRGRVDLVVTHGTVPSAAHPEHGQPVDGTPEVPAARFVEYAPTGTGTWAPTGARFAVPVAELAPAPPLRTREAKSLEEALGWAVVAEAEAGRTPPDPAALRAVYARGVKSYPGPGSTTLSAGQWALGRVDAFTATAAGFRPPGYRGDDDLLPGREN